MSIEAILRAAPFAVFRCCRVKAESTRYNKLPPGTFPNLRTKAPCPTARGADIAVIAAPTMRPSRTWAGLVTLDQSIHATPRLVADGVRASQSDSFCHTG